MIDFFAARSGGDARSSLNALELALDTAARTGEPVTLADAEDAMQRKALRYDKAGDQHYDYISAWIKSTRGSDPDASLYYLAAMLEGGEDARFIARRMVVLASEDVGNADPQALHRGRGGRAHAVEHVGLPECTFALAQAAIYLALAPKSNAAGSGARPPRGRTSASTARSIPPAALRSAAYPAAREARPRRRLRLPARPPRRVNDQEHLPAGREDLRFFDPGDNEPELRERLAAIRGRGAAMREGARCAAGQCGAPRARRTRSRSVAPRAPARGSGRSRPIDLEAAVAAAQDRAPAVVAGAGQLRGRATSGARAVAMLDELDALALRLADETGWPRAHIVLSELLPAARGLRALADDGPRALADQRLSPHAALLAGRTTRLVAVAGGRDRPARAVRLAVGRAGARGRRRAAGRQRRGPRRRGAARRAAPARRVPARRACRASC